MSPVVSCEEKQVIKKVRLKKKHSSVIRKGTPQNREMLTNEEEIISF
jgi:ribosomal protein L30/L7E